MSTDDLSESLFSDYDEKPLDMKKWTFSALFGPIDETFGKFTSISRIERERYFSANKSYPNLHVLANLFVPLNVFINDAKGNKAKIPLEILNDDFIIDEFNETEFFSALMYWPQLASINRFCSPSDVVKVTTCLLPRSRDSKSLVRSASIVSSLIGSLSTVLSSSKPYCGLNCFIL